MRIYLMRHGNAEDAKPGMSDSQRPLTDEGIAQARNAARALVAIDEIPGAFASSTLLRARQSAGIIAAEVEASKPVETDALDPGLDPADTIAWIASRPEKSILLAGHAPSIGALAAALFGDGSAEIHFRKAALMCLTSERAVAQGSCLLEWFLTPKQLGLIGD